MAEQFWFGTEQHSEWIEVPQTGADKSAQDWNAEADFLSGRGMVRSSWMSARGFEFTWGDGNDINLADKIMSYANGLYGRGLIYFVDPCLYDSNTLPPHWADPSMAVDRGASPLIIDWYPSGVPVPLVEVARNLVTNPSMETGSGTVTVRTNLVTNPSFEVNTAGWSAYLSTISWDTTEFYSGTASLKTVFTGVGSSSAVSNVTASQTYTASIWVKAPAGNAFRLDFTELTSTSTIVGVTQKAATGTGSWQRVTATRTFGSTGVKARVELVSTIAQTIYMDAVQLEIGATASDYFDGDTAASGDFTYAWSGTAHASTSLQRGVGFTNFPSRTNTSTFQSQEWANSGTKSLRLSGRTDSNNVWVDVEGDSGGFRLGMEAGKTYTALAKIRLNAPLTGTLFTQSRSIAAFINTGAIIASKAAPNVAGVHEVRVTFTIPSNATAAWIRLYSGASAGNGDVWWDDLIVVEGTYTGDYFDGDSTDTETVTYAWAGTANASQSIAQIENSKNLPVFSARYEITDLEPGFDVTRNNTLFIPKPSGMNLALGAFYSANDYAGVYATPVYDDGTEGGWVRLTELSVGDNDIVPDLFTDPSLVGVRLWAGKGYTNETNFATNPSFETASTTIVTPWGTFPFPDGVVLSDPTSVLAWQSTDAEKYGSNGVVVQWADTRLQIGSQTLTGLYDTSSGQPWDVEGFDTIGLYAIRPEGDLIPAGVGFYELGV